MHWARYLFKKICYLFISLLTIATLTFMLMKSVPGDPFSAEQALRGEAHTALLKEHGMNQSWLIQYKDYLANLLQGNLGVSLKYQGRQVTTIIANGFPTSALLGLEAFCIAVGAGLLLGVLAAHYATTFIDRLIQGILMLGISLPSFIVATGLQYFLAVKGGFFPIARWGTFSHTILPCLSLALLPAAFIAKLTRSSLIEVLQMDYIKTAKAKGLPAWKILSHHALPNALLPVLSYLGQLLAAILIGSFVIEKIFGIPGLGQWLLNSVASRDYPVIMGLTLFYSTILMVIVFLVDIAYGALDPRINRS